MKHTEGNWWADDRQHIHNDPIGSVKVAKVSGANFEEAKANARLISAAPDLLEALIELKNLFEMFGGTFMDEEGSTGWKCDRAIRKAGG